jgi:Na+-transporting methylmalonyl-CoA/oxaloacetate decarboxylase gamma subunit
MPLERDQIADALPSYEIGQELGRGAWGVVVSARHRALARTVAVKQLPRAFAADPAVRARFLTEGRLLASLDHPHIVPVFDFVEKDGLCLLVMELLPQGTVWSRFWAQGFTPPTACATTLAAASGLQAAHEKNVLHRDVKPENMMFSSEGVLKVTDFGIAKVVGGDSTLATRAGEVIGTPAYIAPEQARGGPLSPATDVYALATMLYELLSGQLPFADEADAMALLFKHAYEDPVPLDEKASNIPPPVVPVVMRGLATRPEDRYPSAQSFAIALAEACTSVWGPGWLSAEGVAVMGAGSVVAVTERMGVQPTVRLHAAAGPPPPPATPAGSPDVPALQRARTTVVRPAAPTRLEGAALTSIEDAAPANFVPLQQVVKAPPKPAVPLAIALVAFVVSVVIAFVGLGAAASLGGNIPGGSVRVGGVPLVDGVTVPINLSDPVVISVSTGAPPSSSVRISLLVLGYRAFQSTSPLVTGGGGARVARADLTTARYFVTGHITSEVQLLGKSTGGEIVVGSWRFIASLSQPAWLTVEGVALIVLILFLLAYIEQFTRSLWRGKRRPSATSGLAVSVALLSAAMVAVAWLAAGRQPTLAAVVACTALGAVSGLALAAAAHRAGRLRRLRRRSAARPGTGAVSRARRPA